MSPLKPRVLLSAFAVALLALSGCGVSTSPDDTAVNDPGPAQPSDTTDPAALTITPEESEEPMEQPESGDGELAAITPVEPTVPATPDEPATPEEPESLGIGDAAPPLAIAEWVMGEPIEQLTSGQVYVVEFWATWCPPCRTSMPHISDLQTQYGDEVQFVGVTREDLETVQGFLEQEQSEGKTWNEVVTYRLALDQDSTMSQTYMQAAGQGGIPTAFIVGADGVVEWIGHPMSMEEPLAKIVSGDWDRAAAIAEFEQEKRRDELLASLNGHVRAQEWDEALALIDEFETTEGTTVTQYRMAVLQMAGRTEEAGALNAKLVDEAWDDSAALNEIAWGIAIGRAPGDMELAQRAAERAVELSPEDASILDTLARVYYEQGDLEKAIEYQKQAVEHGAGNPGLASTLEEYEAELAEKTTTPEPAEGDTPSTPEEGASTTPEEGEATPESGDSSPEAGAAAAEEAAAAPETGEAAAEESESAPE